MAAIGAGRCEDPVLVRYYLRNGFVVVSKEAYVGCEVTVMAAEC